MAMKKETVVKEIYKTKEFYLKEDRTNTMKRKKKYKGLLKQTIKSNTLKETFRGATPPRVIGVINILGTKRPYTAKLQ